MAAVPVIIVPGNGGGNVRNANWYGWLEEQLKKHGHKPVLHDMPDPYTARESIWLPFIRDELGADEAAVVVGHSSGAEAGMRLCESTRVRGLVLVSACITDLGDANERASGYYNRPWQWEKIRSNAGWIIQFGSPTDPFLPIAEQRSVADGLKSEYHEIQNGGHFMVEEFSELLHVILEKLGA
ncbi:hypothetical protein KFL_001840110 [Klebsormidium nitens]|uniref:Uncharacterized protein n=1 Tax=Klebsormidium nitens TaxID=105231 RepID=A0A1Y1I2X6_KLENI|nr:hypothetical protein KFL_001840110 [Klebsormidium nitens]|eukprot:GAQ84312.1 hypothetical protein KFL_001840110 [Klebsormidium nitens]